MKQCLSLIFIILGTFIGAGCVSGKETVVYFTNYAQYFLMSIIATIAIIYIFSFYLNFGKKFKITNFTDYSKVLFGKRSRIIDLLFLFCVLCMIGNMFAGLDIMIYNIIPNNLVINIIIILALYIIISHDINGLEKINIVLIPIIIGFILVLCFLSINIESYNTMHTSDISLFKVIIYVFLNVLDISILLSQISNNYSKKSCIISSIVCGVIIFIIIIMQSISFLCNDVLLFDFPLFEISKMFNLQIIYYLVSIFAMFTTLLSAVYIVYSYVHKYFNKFVSVIIISCVGIIISLLGFTFIISYVYVLLGILGFILFLRSVYVYYFSSNNK